LLRETLLTEFDHEMGTTRRLLERVPHDQMQWKPHDKSMSLGELSTHVAGLPRWGSAILADTGFDLAAGPPPQSPCPTPTDVLALFDETTSRTRAAMDKTDAEYLARWTLKRGTQEMFSMPRISAFRTLVLNHLIHHRGQLSVYLRMNNVPVPAIYGPSADEG
jgi:uncharacterized damage-inducible protein DinB